MAHVTPLRSTPESANPLFTFPSTADSQCHCKSVFAFIGEEICLTSMAYASPSCACRRQAWLKFHPNAPAASSGCLGATPPSNWFAFNYSFRRSAFGSCRKNNFGLGSASFYGFSRVPGAAFPVPSPRIAACSLGSGFRFKPATTRAAIFMAPASVK